MPVIQFVCPSCRVTLSMEAAAVNGAMVKCPKCGGVFRLGKPTAAPPVRRGTDVVTSPVPPPAAKPRRLEAVAVRLPDASGASRSRTAATLPRSLVKRPAWRRIVGAVGRLLLAILGLLGRAGLNILCALGRLIANLWARASWRGRLIGLGATGAGVAVIVLVVYLRWPRGATEQQIAAVTNTSPSAVSELGELDMDAAPEEEPDPADAEGPPPANATLPADVLQRVKKATALVRVKLSKGDGSGTGFFAVQPGTMLTNAHVVGMLQPDSLPPERVEIVLDSGEKSERVLPAKVVTVDQTSDLAVLRVESDDARSLPPPLDVGRAGKLLETQQVFIFGFPLGEGLGKNITISTSSVSSLRKDAEGKLAKLQVNGGMHPGNSGGPVVDGRGRVVGVAVSGIINTQLNFAIPGERVATLLNGRIAALNVGAGTHKRGKIAIPVSLQTLDPLKRIDKLAVDWWIGDPGKPRPATSRRPGARTGDVAPRQTATVAYSSDKAAGQVELLLDELPPSSKVLWLQPMLIDGTGKERWLQAVPHPIEPPMVVRETTVTAKNQPGSWPLHLVSRSTFHLRDRDGDPHSIRLDLTTDLTEECESVDIFGKATMRLAMSKFDFVVNVDGEAKPRSSRLGDAVGHADKLTIRFTQDRKGATSQRQVDYGSVPNDMHDTMKHFAEQIVQSLDAVAVPIPDAEFQVEPGQTWQAQRLLPLETPEASVLGLVDMTYTYRGVRPFSKGDLAIVDLSGSLGGNQARSTGLTGESRGAAQIDTATGRVLRAQAVLDATLELPFRGHSAKSSVKLEVRLKRGG
jgi:S1-C subfamily serine protease